MNVPRVFKTVDVSLQTPTFHDTVQSARSRSPYLVEDGGCGVCEINAVGGGGGGLFDFELPDELDVGSGS